MAQRYGGKYSPQGARPAQPGQTPAPPPEPKVRVTGRWRANVLFLSAFAFLFPAFGKAPDAMLLGLCAGGLLILSAWLSREGLRARAEWTARRVARRPAIPRLLFGAATTGAALALGGLIAHGLSIIPAFYALAGAALHYGAFGMDPMRDKGMEGVDAFQSDRVARVLAEAEASLAAMKDAILRASDRRAEGRVDQFAARARALFRQIEADPGDLTAARKYLTVYLTGAKDATVKFADHYAQTKDAQARDDWEALLTDLETTFADRSKALLANDRTDLDIEISVLRDRLKMENR
ncbi:5-bromo-4-chloroindolyl phosphate hydrolysis family protein [Xinfangfangia sp. CPCC 101601]|uniref:5-bromo-4-chloroindolyl phosphate hydrolysis family protein n=1 Tax=Pseudogemmobacter lacusdianii TaxID=3069608 RepID=A0ABU0VT11_9RHOB|nr:5-bromo-4-chloroindolyl phosphate hydrolysis family protein [Xinfangfangia sp. CPCC 101601]MDQ2064861.1 5-bromo-4-chloroindolyl phosphate hydrolysis family protein [Xinfangfangia sp. CPCC 101601]